MDYFLFILFWIVFAFIVGNLGRNRKIGFGLAFLISILLSPLIGLIFVLVSPKKPDLINLKIAKDAGVISDEEFKEKVREVVPTADDKADTRRGYLIVAIIILVILLLVWIF